jgi:aryl-alcohol dehydrogenase-like predicted oxidoreductase
MIMDLSISMVSVARYYVFLLFNRQDGLTVSMQHIFDSVKHSLRRLDLDYIDVLQCHRFDANTPVEETVCCSPETTAAG